MQKVITPIFAILTLLSFPTLAEQIESIAQKFTNKLEKLNQFQNCSSENTNHLQKLEQDLTESIQCVKELCGPLDQIENIFPTEKTESVWNDPRLSNSISLFEKAVRKEEEARTAALKAAAERLKDSKFTFSDDVINEKSVHLVQGFSESIFLDSKVIIDQAGRTKISSSSETTIRRQWKNWGLTKEEISYLLPVLKNDPYAKIAAIQGSGAAFVYDYLYPDVAFQQAIREDIEKARTQIKSTPVTFAAKGMGHTIDQLQPSFSMAENQAYVDDELGTSILNNVKLAHFKARLQENPALKAVFRRVAKREMNLNRKRKIKEVEDMLNSEKEDFSELSDPKKLMSNLKPKNPGLRNLFNSCFTNLTYALAEYPTKEQIDSAVPKLERSKDEILQGLTNILSPDTLKCISPTIKKIRIALPPSATEYAVAFNTLIKTTLNDSEAILAALKTDRSGDFSVAYASRPNINGWPQPIDLYSRCHDLNVRPISDHTDFGYNVIAISAEGVKHEDFGVDVAKHEIGHLVSNLLQNSTCVSEQSKNEFLNSRRCLNNIQPADISGKEGFRFEEDFADLISAKSSTSKKNLWCGLYKDASSDSNRLKIVPASGDSHSSVFFRMLNIEIAKNGSLPKACLNSLPDSYKPKDCWPNPTLNSSASKLLPSSE